MWSTEAGRQISAFFKEEGVYCALSKVMLPETEVLEFYLK